ncbi:cytochrome P450 [Mycena galopus ATCC 62051]|nr:cytochrome P450 [Mycena galopus ATCC 62051]
MAMPSLDLFSTLVLPLLLLAGAVLLKRWKTTSRFPLPPGPKPMFIMGNFYDIPTELPWVTYREWGRQYGDLVHAEVFGNHILVINSLNTATDLLEKRARIYSDRPTIPMLPLLAAAIIMAAVYGYDIESTHSDQFVYLAEEGMRRIGESLLPGASAVNTFPFLRHFPSWFPGCGFHRFARDTSDLIDEMKNAPFDFVRQNIRDGTGKPSVLRELLENNDVRGGSREREDMIKDVAAVAYASAADTTAATIVIFIMAMALNPEVLRKAQNEINTVVGVGCLPGFEHRSSLLYCEAIVREVFRWKPILPLGVPHATSEDDIYAGYFIPKGRHAADATVWITVVSILSAFNIAKAKDEKTGKEIEIELSFTDEAISHPKPFKCAITPRNDGARQLIENLATDS